MREQNKIPDAMFFNRIFERCMPKEELTKEEMSKEDMTDEQPK